VKAWSQHTAAWLVAGVLLTLLAAMSLHSVSRAVTPISPVNTESVPPDRPDRKAFDERWTDGSEVQ
jgi:hypothetical protein